MKFSNFNGHINKAKKKLKPLLKSGASIKNIASSGTKNSNEYLDNFLQLLSVSKLAKKEEINVYIESDKLLKFLSSTRINGSSIDNLKKMLVQNMGEESNFTYAIHMPNMLNSIILHIQMFNTGNHTEMGGQEQVFAAIMMVRDDYGFFKFTGLPWDKNHTSPVCDTEKEWRICLNLLMYINTFPDLLKNEAPSIAMIRPQGASKTLKEVEGISSHLRDDVSPHFRRGHFMVLRSERYGKNRMKSVYRKPCFVGKNSATLTA